jgi:UDP-N-acetylmuramyl pentapeptide synthase
VLTLASTPGGRLRLLEGANQYAWPLLYRVASFHRRTVARRCRVVCVVGTFGKTTTPRAAVAALGLCADRAQRGNCWSLLAKAVLAIRPADRYAVVEAGISGPGQMARYERMICPDVAVVTCIGSEHHTSLGTLDAAREEKSRMLGRLPRAGLAVLNGDDAHVVRMAGRTRARVVRYGFVESNDVRASGVEMDWPRGMRFRLHAQGEVRQLAIRLIGRHMVQSILAAATLALAEGVCLNEVVLRLERLPPTPGRLEPVPLADGAFVLRDDFKSAEETIESALDTLAEVPAPRRIAVLGDVDEPRGSQGPVYRRLGARTAGVASLMVIVGGSKCFQRYAAGAARAGMARQAMVWAGDSALEAARVLRDGIRPGDVVLVKGRHNQRLERVALALQGRPVRCGVGICRYEEVTCTRCPMLTRGWDGRRIVT